MSRTFQHRCRASTAVLLLLTLVYAPISGAASHYCFDGAEPPVSLHFDNLDGHDSHEDEPDHVDLEKRVHEDNLVGKIIDLALAVTDNNVATVQIRKLKSSSVTIENTGLHKPNIWQLTPPLRAPPQLS